MHKLIFLQVEILVRLSCKKNMLPSFVDVNFGIFLNIYCNGYIILAQCIQPIKR